MGTDLDTKMINAIRGLSMDGVEAAKSGHAGLPLGAAPMATALWARHLKFDPKDPKWFDRDRFVLSAGHGSMLLYSLLHLTGGDLALDELKNFRQLHSKTPGHPENVLTPGVEMATGPLGQGVAHSVGMAIAERYLAAHFNKPGGPTVCDHHTYAICSDGDLMEGVASEAASLAGHLGLGKLIWLYDDNGITIDGTTDLAFTEDVGKRFEAYDWQVIKVDGMDIDAVDAALVQAKEETARPTLIQAKTIIGFGSAKLQGTNKAHSNPFGPEEVAATKIALGLPDGPFEIDPEALAGWHAVGARGTELHKQWAELAAGLSDDRKAIMDGELGDAWLAALPASDAKIATRKASEGVINAIAPHLPGLIGGSADLTESNLTHQKASGDFQRDTPEGKNINFGVREFAMCCAVNGITLHGGTRGYGASFLVFSDYARPAIRLAALMELPSIFVFTHDSVGVGEDGPTHEPVEHLTAMRVIPNLNVFRPADANETAAGWKIALESEGTPTFLALSRQALPAITPADVRNHPAEKGAYVLHDEADPHVTLIGTGSEIQHCLAARETLAAEGIRARVVSMPSWFLFERQESTYKASVLPKGLPAVSIEAGSTLAWPRYSDAQVGIDRFGLSAPGDQVMKELGITPENLAETTRKLLRGDDDVQGVRSAGGTDHKGPGEIV